MLLINLHLLVLNLLLDLFGEERGQIALRAVLSVRILDEDSNVLMIQSTDRTYAPLPPSLLLYLNFTHLPLL